MRRVEKSGIIQQQHFRRDNKSSISALIRINIKDILCISRHVKPYLVGFHSQSLTYFISKNIGAFLLGYC